MCDILLPVSLYPGGEEYPSTSVVGKIIKKKVKCIKLVIVTNNIEQVFPISLSLQQAVTQNCELLIQIS